MRIISLALATLTPILLSACGQEPACAQVARDEERSTMAQVPFGQAAILVLEGQHLRIVEQGGNERFASEVTDALGVDEFQAIAEGPNGSAYVQARRANGEAVVARFDAAGSLDASFGTSGVARLPAAASIGLTVRWDGGAVLATEVTPEGGTEGNQRYRLIHVGPSGAPDATFDGREFVLPPRSQFDLHPVGEDLVIREHALKSVIQYGYEYWQSFTRFHRMPANGGEIHALSLVADGVLAQGDVLMAVRNDGDPLNALSEPRGELRLYTADGSPDPAFASGGVLRLPKFWIEQLILEHDGFLVVGFEPNGTEPNERLAMRFDATGRLLAREKIPGLTGGEVRALHRLNNGSVALEHLWGERVGTCSYVTNRKFVWFEMP